VALSQAQLDLLHGELAPDPWGGPDDSELDDIFTLRGGVVGVIRQVWSTRLATLLANPASFQVSGEYGQNVTANIEAIRRRLFELSAYPDSADVIPPGGGLTMFTVIQLTRVGQDR
jgi:hypothetical protein